MKNSFLIIAALVFGSLAHATPETCLNAEAASSERSVGSQEQLIKEIIKQNKGKALVDLDWSHRGDFTSPTGHVYAPPNLIEDNIPEKMRSAVILDGTTIFATNDEIPDVITVGNVRHNEEIYIAQFHWKKIARIEIQKQQMSVVPNGQPGSAEINSLVAHARIKFIFEEAFPARLVKKISPRSGETLTQFLSSINSSSFAETAIVLPSISLSAEALTDKYDFVKGADEKYAFGHFFQAESVPEGIHRAGGGALESISIGGLSEDDKKNIFLESLITSQLMDRTCDEVPKYKNTYNLVTNNCIASTFKVLERAGLERRSCSRDDVDTFLEAIPPMTADTRPSAQMTQLIELLQAANIPRETTVRVANSLQDVKKVAIREEDGRHHYPNAWVATRIECWLPE